MPKITLINRCDWSIAFKIKNEYETLVSKRLLLSNQKFEVPVYESIEDDDYWVNVSSQGRETIFYLSAKEEENNFEIHDDGIHLNGIFLTNHFY
jgi:hypothetical protein